jgi:hypothetical protein
VIYRIPMSHTFEEEKTNFIFISQKSDQFDQSKQEDAMRGLASLFAAHMTTREMVAFTDEMNRYKQIYKNKEYKKLAEEIESAEKLLQPYEVKSHDED